MKEKIQWIAWESCKLVILITCVILMSANVLMTYYTIETNRAIDCIWSDMQDFHKEEMETLKEIKP